MPTATLRTAVDAWVREDKAGANYGGQAVLRLDGTGADERRGFVFFGRPYPLGTTIVSATLYLTLRGGGAGWGGGPHTITARRVTGPWKERRVNWNNAPAVTAANEATEAVNGGSPGEVVAIDVTAMIQDVAAGGAWYGIRLTIDTDGTRNLHSAEAGNPDVRPYLEIEWAEGFAPPDNLRPSGGRAVSLAAGTLAWDARHGNSEEEPAAYQVQITTVSEDYAAPEFDSGEVASSDTRIDLTTAGYAGTPDGATRYWRVRAKDAQGTWSDWSDEAEFRRQTHGDLTITNPALDGDNVEETTPPIVHNYTATQEALEHILHEDASGGGTFAEIHRERRRATADGSWQVPAGLIRYDGANRYRVLVRAWDDVDRQGMPGDPPYLEAERTFGLALSATPTAPAGLTATPDEAKVALAWSRATAPDYFALVVDGRIVEDRIDPAEVSAGGTDYAMTWWKARPGVESTYEIQAVVDDAGVLKHSTGNPSDTATTRPTGMYLLAPEAGLEVLIYGKDTPTLEIGESGETYRLPGRRGAHREIGTPHGYQGQIVGLLDDGLGVTGATYRDRLEQMIGLAGSSEIRAVIGDLNIPVLLEPPYSVPPAAAGYYPVAVQVVQTGEFTFEVVGG